MRSKGNIPQQDIMTNEASSKEPKECRSGKERRSESDRRTSYDPDYDEPQTRREIDRRYDKDWRKGENKDRRTENND